jgi:hypothetical protein
LRPVRAAAFLNREVASFNFNAVALTGRWNGGAYPLTRGFAPGYMQLRFQRAFVAVSILQSFNFPVFAATIKLVGKL